MNNNPYEQLQKNVANFLSLILDFPTRMEKKLDAILESPGQDILIRLRDSVIKYIKEKAFPGDEAVAISFCFPDTGIEGYIGCDKSLVRNVNGVKVRNLRHLVELVDSCKSGFVCFGLDRDTEWDVKAIVDAKEMREATVRVMKRNQIPADRSEDLRKK